jgi:hypothetical protein
MSLACATTIPAGRGSDMFILGTRAAAAQLRQGVENALAECGNCVCVDFHGVLVSQSFMDEFLGVLITRHGPAILERIALKNCHPDVKAAAQFVTSVRSREFQAH